MRQFASRDLMVATLPEESVDVWAAGADCTQCTDETQIACCPQTEKPTRGMAGDDLPALQEQLRAART